MTAKKTRKPKSLNQPEEITHAKEPKLKKKPESIVDDGPSIAELIKWGDEQRQKYADGTLPKAFINYLEGIPGWTWLPIHQVPKKAKKSAK
ncbi:MAG TPA: hypothetical protein VGF01_20405 [Terracidiphilus sp.]|jgi:hypothetical protein